VYWDSLQGWCEVLLSHINVKTLSAGLSLEEGLTSLFPTIYGFYPLKAHLGLAASDTAASISSL